MRFWCGHRWVFRHDGSHIPGCIKNRQHQGLFDSQAPFLHYIGIRLKVLLYRRSFPIVPPVGISTSILFRLHLHWWIASRNWLNLPTYAHKCSALSHSLGLHSTPWFRRNLGWAGSCVESHQYRLSSSWCKFKALDMFQRSLVCIHSLDRGNFALERSWHFQHPLRGYCRWSSETCRVITQSRYYWLMEYMNALSHERVYYFRAPIHIFYILHQPSKIIGLSSMFCSWLLLRVCPCTWLLRCAYSLFTWYIITGSSLGWFGWF